MDMNKLKLMNSHEGIEMKDLNAMNELTCKNSNEGIEVTKLK